MTLSNQRPLQAVLAAIALLLCAGCGPLVVVERVELTACSNNVRAIEMEMSNADQ